MSSFRGFRKERLPEPLTYYENQGLRLSGRSEWRSARCPLHDDRDPSLSIHVPSGGFNCHGCGEKGGDVLDFHRKRYKLSFKDAAQALGAWEEPVRTATPDRIPFRHLRLTPAQEAARRFAGAALNNGYKPEALHEYRDERGTPLYYVIRAKEPKSGKKWIRPMHRTGTDFVLGLPKFERGRKPLYGLDQFALRPGEAILVCEGEKCADALRNRGLLSITSGASNSADHADWMPLAGRQVLIWPDHDEPGHRYTGEVLQRLAEIGCRTEVIDTAKLGLDEAGDAIDWFKAHPEATNEVILGLARQDMSYRASIPASTDIAATAEHADLEIINRWCAERCIRHGRAWGGVLALYRDFCDWCGPDYAFAPGEFVELLNQLGIGTIEMLAEGLLLVSDLDGMESLLT
jgi:hypothetical protein